MKEEKKVAKKVAKKAEEIVEKKVAKKVSKKVAKKVEEEAEEKVAKKVEEKVEKETPKKVAKKVAKKVVEEVEEKAEEKKVEKKIEERVEEKAEEIVEKEVEEEVEDEVEKKAKKEAKKVTKKKVTKAAKKGGMALENILDLNATNIWNLDEFAIAQAWEAIREVEDFTISEPKLLNIIRLAFDVVHYNPENEREVAKYENGGWAKITHCQEAKGCVAIRRKAIERITDLSYENIRHISTAMLLELINRNFGGGWDSISLAIRDIIETGFEISTTQLPQSRIHAPGGTVEKKVAQGFDVLEIPKGTWVEAIFAKKKDPVEKIHIELPEREDELDIGEEPEEEGLENDDTYYSSLTPEEDVQDLEEEGLSIEDINEGEEDE